MQQRLPLVAGNWKMFGDRATNDLLLHALAGTTANPAGPAAVERVVCAPFPYLSQVSALLSGSSIGWGAQTCSEHQQGAYTGEVSPVMLADLGCSYVLVGHSERRALFGETDAVVAAKFQAAQVAGLTPILCVGETLAEREGGVTDQVVVRQLDAVIDRVGIAALAKSVLAYEPVWAIGTGKTASPEQAQAVHATLRAALARRDATVAATIRILYGGSVKPANAAELFAKPDIDGGLIGGASLVAADFAAIAQALSRAS